MFDPSNSANAFDGKCQKVEIIKNARNDKILENYQKSQKWLEICWAMSKVNNKKTMKKLRLVINFNNT